LLNWPFIAFQTVSFMLGYGISDQRDRKKWKASLGVL
jgi:hypothetical protein